jgi:hypothetical protein
VGRVFESPRARTLLRRSLLVEATLVGLHAPVADGRAEATISVSRACGSQLGCRSPRDETGCRPNGLTEGIHYSPRFNGRPTLTIDLGVSDWPPRPRGHQCALLMPGAVSTKWWSPGPLVSSLSRVGPSQTRVFIKVLRRPPSRCERRYKTGALSNRAS